MGDLKKLNLGLSILKTALDKQMSGKGKSSIKGTTKRTQAPMSLENTIKFVFQSHYITLFNSIRGTVIGKFNDGEQIFTTEQFLSTSMPAEAKKSLTNPTPSNIKLAIVFICDVFDHYMRAIENDDEEFCDMMLALPDVHDMTLRSARDPLNYIATKVAVSIPKTKEVDDNIARNLGKLIKLLVEAYSLCHFVGNRIPKVVPLETLCAICGMSGELLVIARNVKLPEPKKKGAAATSATSPVAAAGVFEANADDGTKDDVEETS